MHGEADQEVESAPEQAQAWRMTRLDQAKSVAIALAIPPVVALPLAVITGLASTGFFAFGLVAGWLYLRPRIQVVRGILLFCSTYSLKDWLSSLWRWLLDLPRPHGEPGKRHIRLSSVWICERNN